MHPLDQPIWNALTTAQASFARACGDAACFPNEVTRLAGLREGSTRACSDLASLLAPGERTGLFLTGPIVLGPELVEREQDTLLQMIHEDAVEPVPETEELGPADHEAMRALAALTRPGPFGTRTHELGCFLGVREGGALVAMAGQRLRLDGLVEVSAICTHPEHAGRGHAARLIRAQLARIHGSGSTPFLHVRSSNQRAVALYEHLGFRTRREVRYLVVERG